ncbi:hypothetical protein [Neisseria sicca]|uniref:hypothetical protein n=1 Tax=Neisseria sicca TaxID=490 RepID=UPI0011BD0F66|nr:hypothetical protein [Neisseria sicca]
MGWEMLSLIMRCVVGGKCGGIFVGGVFYVVVVVGIEGKVGEYGGEGFWVGLGGMGCGGKYGGKGGYFDW